VALAPPAPGVSRLAPEPQRHAVVLTCMDVRIDPLAVLGFAPGDAHVLRNGGGIVTDDVVRSLILSQRLLGTTSITVVAHTECGLSRIDEESFADRLERETGVRPAFRFGATADPAETVRSAFARLEAEPLVRSDDVRGFVYDVKTDRLTAVSRDTTPSEVTT
jgi:carbonic anhydrase